jgi:hypothetical protein
VVARPAAVETVVRALRRGGRGPVALTAATPGMGGSGTTTLAQIVCADQRVQRRFGDGMHWAPLGRHVVGRAVLEAAQRIRARIPAPDPSGSPRVLVVLDDVWSAEQLRPFLDLPHVRVLLTTRFPEVLPRDGVTVPVGPLTDPQARVAMIRGLAKAPGSPTSVIPPAAVAELAAATDGWPQLVRLVNRTLATETARGLTGRQAALVVLDRLQSVRTGHAVRTITVGTAGRLACAARVVMGTAVGSLDADAAARLTELGIFAAGEEVPLPLVTTLWRATAGRDDDTGRQLCRQLASSGLLTMHPGRDDHGTGHHGTVGPGANTGVDQGVRLPDVVRDDLRRVGIGDRLADLNRALLAALAARLPAAPPLVPGTPSARVAWWVQAGTDPYLAAHLIEHLIDAGHLAEADALAGDLRWISVRLQRSGPGAVATDLGKVSPGRSTAMLPALHAAAPFLIPTAPAPAPTLPDILFHRVRDDPAWAAQVRAAQVRALTADQP